MANIIAVDSIMGSGKTSWAIQYMNENRDQRFIYITPYLDEIKRIKKSCRRFTEPEEYPFTKQGHFLRLLEDGRCIATTHELFKRSQLTPHIIQLIQEYHYTLILDEMIDAVQKINISVRDFRILFSEKLVEVVQREDGTEIIKWVDDDYIGELDEYKELIKSKTIIKYKEYMLIWLLPPELLSSFENIYILTFLFRKSQLEQYLKIHKMNYTLCYTHGIADDAGTRKYELATGIQDISQQKAHIKELLNIYQGSLNRIGDDKRSLNFTYWDGLQPGKRRMVANNALEYFNLCEADSSEIMWTCFKGRSKSEPSIKGQYKSRFLASNTRATNKWSQSNVLAYLVNVNPDPNIMNWFRERDGNVDEEQYALSSMIQWIWRSAIQNDKPVRLYIPSKRMREMLMNWLDSDSEHEAA